MSHTINRQFVHLMWPTKNLSSLIPAECLSPLMAYLNGTLQAFGGNLVAGSGTSNHVHLLVNTPTHLSITDLLRQIKACSSKWFREMDTRHLSFNWNEGYCAFTVSPSSIENVKQYLAAEEHRHMTNSFEDELKYFLQVQDVEFNANFLTTTTHDRLIYHLVWSVKNRDSFLSANFQAPLHQRIKDEILANGSKLYAIGNVADHIHILIESTTKTCMSDLVQSIKTKTTHLIKSLDKKLSCFCWQEGYGVFSVGKPALESVLRYVNDQENHHRKTTFEQEWNLLKM